MNINEHMLELGDMGGLAYAPSDDLISSLLARTKRVRVARQSTTTIIGTLSVLAIGIAAVQAYSATRDDPAFRDRNGINNKDGLTSIELYRAKFGNENPTRTFDSGIDLSSIIAKLKAAAASGSSHPNIIPGKQPTEPVQPAAPVVVNVPVAPPTTSPTTPPADPYVKCRADHPDKPGKYYDCPTSQWIVKAGWYQDPANSEYYQCSAQPGSYVGYSYDCSTGKYAAKEGYFWFGNGSVYQAVTWLDSATGVASTGNWSGSGNWGGWDQKAIFVSPGSKTYSEYVYMGSNATWSGTTCTGVSKAMYGATWHASCLPKSKVTTTNMTYKMKDDIAWILDNQDLRWHSCLNIYADPANPPEGWVWDGSSWQEEPDD